MALISCPECGKEISEQADNCPHCAYPIKKIAQKAEFKEKHKQSPIAWVVLLVVIAGAAYVVNDQLQKTYDAEQAAQKSEDIYREQTQEYTGAMSKAMRKERGLE